MTIKEARVNGSPLQVPLYSIHMVYRPVQLDFDDGFLPPNFSSFSYVTTNLSSVMQQLFAFRLVI